MPKLFISVNGRNEDDIVFSDNYAKDNYAYINDTLDKTLHLSGPTGTWTIPIDKIVSIYFENEEKIQ